MARYRKVDPRIWNDEKFRTLSDRSKLVFFMLLTHPGMTALGAMRATVSGLAEELGWDVEAFRKAFQQALDKGMVEHDQKACLIALPNFVRYNTPESPNVVKAWVGALDLLPECDLKTAVLHRAKQVTEDMQEGFAKAFTEAFDKGSAKTMPNQKQEPKQKPKRPPPPPADAGGAFEKFWQSWPKHKRKVAPSQCRAKWVKKGCEQIADKVLEALEKFKASDDWQKNGGEFIPAPLVWLNQDRWEAVEIEKTSAPPVVSPAIAKTSQLLEEQKLTPEQIEANKLRAAEIRKQMGGLLRAVV